MLMGTDIFHSCQLVKQVILPRIHGLALKTTVAAVCIFLILTLSFYLFLDIIWAQLVIHPNL